MSRSNADTPGRSTFSVTSHAVARSNKTLGRSVPVQHRAYSQRARRNRAPPSVNSRYPNPARISRACCHLARPLSPPLIDPTRLAPNHSPLSGTGRSVGSAQAQPPRPAVSADASSRGNSPRPRSAATSRTGPPDLIRFPTGAPRLFSPADHAGLKGNSQSHRPFTLRSKPWPKIDRPCARAFWEQSSVPEPRSITLLGATLTGFALLPLGWPEAAPPPRLRLSARGPRHRSGTKPTRWSCGAARGLRGRLRRYRLRAGAS